MRSPISGGRKPLHANLHASNPENPFDPGKNHRMSQLLESPKVAYHLERNTLFPKLQLAPNQWLHSALPHLLWRPPPPFQTLKT